MDVASDHALKRKRDADSKPQDPKLQEYLALAHTSSKTRTWANDDSTAMAMAAEQAVAPINTPAQDTSPSEELPSHPKKVRVLEPAFDADTEKPSVMEVDRSDEDVEGVTPVQEETEAAQDEAGPVSDSDWLRSKTSRLLGLLDEDEQAEFDQHKVAQPAESSRDAEESRTAAFEDVPPQPVTDDATVEDGDAVETTPERPDPNVDLIRDSARLFVRNLAYDTTDADLQPLFAPFGKLDEVSDLLLLFFFFFFFFLFPTHQPRYHVLSRMR
jgi:multiple RNA-binding domain-containing protein 1